LPTLFQRFAGEPHPAILDFSMNVLWQRLALLGVSPDRDPPEWPSDHPRSRGFAYLFLTFGYLKSASEIRRLAGLARSYPISWRFSAIHAGAMSVFLISHLSGFGF
jgi:hypothetical protein